MGRFSHLSEPESPRSPVGRGVLRKGFLGSLGSVTSHPKVKRERASSQGAEGWRSRRRPIFDDKETVKTRVREALLKPAYHVEDYYYTEGLWQQIARSHYFEFVTMVVIGVNSIWLAVDTDYNQASVPLDAAPLFQFADHMFCTFFLSEWIIRFMSFQRKCDGFRDPWFALDTLLILMMVLDTWIVSIIVVIFSVGVRISLSGSSPLRLFRLLRLLRIARMARLLRVLPELMILIKGMLAAVRSVGFTLALLVAVLYVFAIAFTQLCMDTQVGPLYFPTISTSMYNLLVCGVFLDGIGQCLTDLFATGPQLAFLFLLFVFLAAFTLMNMLIGVVCEVVAGVAESEKERTSVMLVKEKLQHIVENFSVEAPNRSEAMINKSGFMLLMEDVDAIRALNDVGVDPEHLVDLSDVIFDGSDDLDSIVDKTLSFGDFMEIVLQFRGSNSATVKDIVNIQKNLRRSVEQARADMELRLKVVDENIRAIAEVLNVPLKANPFTSVRPKLLRHNALALSYRESGFSLYSGEKDSQSLLRIDPPDGLPLSPIPATAMRAVLSGDRIHVPLPACDAPPEIMVYGSSELSFA